MKISCRKVKNQFSLLRDQQLNLDLEKEIFLHLEGCSNCSLYWKQYNQSLDTLFSKPEELEAVPSRVWARFRSELATERQGWVKELWWERELVSLKWGGALAFGMAAFLFFGVLWTQENQIQDLAAQNLLTNYEYGKVLSVL